MEHDGNRLLACEAAIEVERVDRAEDVDLQACFFSSFSHDGGGRILAGLHAPAAWLPLSWGVILRCRTLEKEHVPIAFDEERNHDEKSLAHRLRQVKYP